MNRYDQEAQNLDEAQRKRDALPKTHQVVDFRPSSLFASPALRVVVRTDTHAGCITWVHTHQHTVDGRDRYGIEEVQK